MPHKTCSIFSVSGIVCLIGGYTLLTGFASGQTDQNRTSEAPNVVSYDSKQKAYEHLIVKDRLPDAMSRLKQGSFFPADVHIIAEAGVVQAIPDLKKQFELTHDQILKGSIASALVRLGIRTLPGGTTSRRKQQM